MKKRKPLRLRFDRSLFTEALYQLRFGVIAYVLLSLALGIWGIVTSPKNCIPYLSEDGIYIAPSITDMTAFTSFWTPMGGMLFTAIALVYLYSFFYSSKARDFYCALPFSIGSLWLNFTAASFAPALLGVFAAHFVQLFSSPIFAAGYFFIWLKGLLSSLAYVAFTGAAISLAGAITGKLTSFLPLSLCLTLLPDSLIKAFFIVSKSYYGHYSFYISKMNTDFRVFTCLFNAVKTSNTSYYSDQQAERYYSLSADVKQIAILFILTLFYLAAAAIAVNKRSGKSSCTLFINKMAHYASMLIINTVISSFILSHEISKLSYSLFCKNNNEVIEKFSSVNTTNCFSYAKITNDSTYSSLSTGIVEILAVAILIIDIFWITEVMLSLNLKKSLNILKIAPMPIIIIFMVSLLGILGDYDDFKSSLAYDNIQSVTVNSINVNSPHDNTLDNSSGAYDINYTLYNLTYASSFTNEALFKAELTNPELIKYLSEELSFAQKNKYTPPRVSDYNVLSYDEGNISFIIKLKDGRIIKREISHYTDELMLKLYKAFLDNEDIMEKCLKLPDSSELNLITLEQTNQYYFYNNNNNTSISSVKYIDDNSKLLSSKESIKNNSMNVQAASKITDKEAAAIYKIFKQEYEAKSLSEKIYLYDHLIVEPLEATYGHIYHTSVPTKDSPNNGSYNNYSEEYIRQNYVFYESQLMPSQYDIETIENRTSYTDKLALKDKSNAKTIYLFDDRDYLEMTNDNSFKLLLSGYHDRAVTDSNRFFLNSISLSSPFFLQYFPTTNRAVKEIKYADKFNVKAFDISSNSLGSRELFIDFYNKENTPCRLYITGAKADDNNIVNGNSVICESQCLFDVYDHEAYKAESHEIKVKKELPIYEIDVDSLINQLKTDSERTKKIDTLKPYCYVFYIDNGKTSQGFYIQSDLSEYIDTAKMKEKAEKFKLTLIDN